MCSIQNVTRKQGTYYSRRLIRLGRDKPFLLRFSLKTTSRKRAALLAPTMTLICERLAMNMTAKIATDALTAAQRAEIFRRQMLVERDRLEVLHAQLHILPPEDHEDVEKALSLRLGASEMAARDAYYDTIWTKIARALPFLKSGQATQSFRHTVINAMKGAEVMPELRADFAGHKLSSETEGRYSKAHVALLRKAATAIPNVTDHLEPFPVTLLPARLRAPRKARTSKQSRLA